MTDIPTLANPQYMKFAEAYLRHFNQTQAAIDAGYAETSAANQGYRLMRNEDVRAYVRARMAEEAMDTDEVLYHLAQVARGDMSNFIDDNSLSVNILAAREKNKMNLVKKIKYTTFANDDTQTDTVEFELYDKLKALELIGKAQAMFTDKTDITSGGKELKALTELSDDELSRIAAGRG